MRYTVESGARPTPAANARTRTIITGIARGKTNQQIARALNDTPARVRHDVTHLLTVTGCASRAELVAYGYTHGLLDPSAWPAQAKEPHG